MSRTKSEHPVRSSEKVPEAEVSKQEDRERLVQLEAETETVLEEMKGLLQDKERRRKKTKKTNVA